MDYGPFGFLDTYDPNFVSNGSDSEGRYRFQNQPEVCRWNLEKLFDSFALHFPNIRSKLDEIIKKYCEQCKKYYLNQMRKKLGLFKSFPEDFQLIESLLDCMYKTNGDFTNIFRCLSQLELQEHISPVTPFPYEMYGVPATQSPVTACDLITGKSLSLENSVRHVNSILKHTQSESLVNSQYLWVSWLKLYQLRLQKESDHSQSRRITMMNLANPKYILRNYLVDQAIQKAEKGDYNEIQQLLDVLTDPYDIQHKDYQKSYDKPPPVESPRIFLTCSS